VALEVVPGTELRVENASDGLRSAASNGNPPTQRCTAELSNPRADEAAGLGVAIQALRPPGTGNNVTTGAESK
jgi:hypothetical protein